MSGKCIECGKGRAREINGEMLHLKCVNAKSVVKCSKEVRGMKGNGNECVESGVKGVKKSYSGVCEKFENSKQKATVGVNGNVYISVTQVDSCGRTTIIREIKKDKVSEYEKRVQSDEGGDMGVNFIRLLMGTSSKLSEMRISN
jgi:hypothetical protein